MTLGFKQAIGGKPTYFAEKIIYGLDIDDIKMKMPVGTFKHKFNETGGKYHFTEDEKERLFTVLRELATDIEGIVGVTFNQALSQIVSK